MQRHYSLLLGIWYTPGTPRTRGWRCPTAVGSCPRLTLRTSLTRTSELSSGAAHWRCQQAMGHLLTQQSYGHCIVTEPQGPQGHSCEQQLRSQPREEPSALLSCRAWGNGYVCKLETPSHFTGCQNNCDTNVPTQPCRTRASLISLYLIKNFFAPLFLHPSLSTGSGPLFELPPDVAFPRFLSLPFLLCV